VFGYWFGIGRVIRPPDVTSDVTTVPVDPAETAPASGPDPADPSPARPDDRAASPAAASPLPPASAPQIEQSESDGRALPQRRAATTSARRPGRPASTAATGPAISERDGRMLVRSTPAGAAVRVNGVERGTTPLVLRGLAHGRYAISVALPGHATMERDVVITAAAPAVAMTLDLDRPETQARGAAPTDPPALPQHGDSASASRPVSSVEFISRPAGARIFLDGQPIGTTPLRLAVAPGPHAVRLEQNGYATWSANVNAAPDRVTRVSASLEPAQDR
jgi:hypothetical protein